MGRGRRGRDYYGFGEYVPVAERQRKAQKKMETLQKKGEEIQPIEPFKTRGISTSFWGKSWCRHLESFSDYENRLPRGRSYVRNGSVCHLGVDEGAARAYVSGSELYELSIHIEPLDPAKWVRLKEKCGGKIGSLIELLQGRISDEVMEIVTDRDEGLFPHPHEIRFNCNCPDWADMCKHVAAVMYGIGVRLDTNPELLFKLRGVNYEELVSVDSAIGDLTDGKRSRRRRTLSDDSIGNVFGIDLDGEAEPVVSDVTPRRRIKKSEEPVFKPSGAAVRELRKKLSMSPSEFAQKVGVSSASIVKWEKVEGTLNLQAKSLALLEQVHKDVFK